MVRKPNESDLFTGSTMTFGEHLEELRGALFRSLIGIVAGFLIGLWAANYVVPFIQVPLRNALQEFYQQQALRELQAHYGHDLPEDQWSALRQFIIENEFTYEEVYLEASLLRELLAGIEAGDGGNETGVGPAAEGSEPAADARREPAGDEGGAAAGDEGGAAAPGVGSESPAADERAARGLVETRRQILPAPDATMVKTRMWRHIRTEIISLGAQEAFMIWLKAGFIFGLILASPWVFYQIWSFVAAGLYSHEKRWVYVFLPFSLLLFLAGAAMAFFVVFEYVLDFLFSFNARLGIDPDPRISEWIGFALFLPLGFGIAFQLPLVMLFLNRIGIFTVEAYRQKWRMAILIIFVLSMVLTPADPISMLLMAGPLCLLYFGGIALCRWMPRGRSRFDHAYDPGQA